MKLTYIYKFLFVLSIGSFVACNDSLDEEPQSSLIPENYLNAETQLESYANNLYDDILPGHEQWSYGIFGEDKNTDNMANIDASDEFVPGLWKTPQKDSNWNFKNIYDCNYFLDDVLPKWKENKLSGNQDNINHYIGEVYFLRAFEYFTRYQMFGDFPIIRHTLSDNMEILTEASKRMPRTEVARFIISDLDSAIVLMDKNPDKLKTRISKEAALMLKSRVALYEGTWLKYFANTAFVPNGPEWPGKNKAYNANYTFESNSLDGEIDYFLTQCMDASKQIAETIPLVENTGEVQQEADGPVNPFMDMFGSVDLTGYSEVILWRQYNEGLNVVHNVAVEAQRSNKQTGITRSLVQSFLMSDGLPIYASKNYQGDETISDVRANRDSRLSIFMKEPGQLNVLYPSPSSTHAVPIEPIPDIISTDVHYTTGYALRKGGSYDGAQLANGKSYTGAIIFRSAEAYLNYMEADYEKNGTLDQNAQSYWRALRERSHVDTDFNKTIAATDMNEEAKTDWGAYSAGKIIDATLFNIRRERRCELMAENFRNMDIRRWRAMDQMITTPYHIEGFKLWGSMQEWYKNEDGSSKLIYGLDDPKSNVSSPSLSKYLRPYEISNRSTTVNGYSWLMAHYLQPIAIQNLMITSSDGSNVETSPIYQNPYWPTAANMGAIK